MKKNTDHVSRAPVANGALGRWLAVLDRLAHL
jgi:hypothetical protein